MKNLNWEIRFTFNRFKLFKNLIFTPALFKKRKMSLLELFYLLINLNTKLGRGKLELSYVHKYVLIKLSKPIISLINTPSLGFMTFLWKRPSEIMDITKSIA